MKEWIAGRNPVYEVLQARQRQLFRLLVAKGVEEKGRLADLIHLAASRKLPADYVPRQQLDALGENHQGVCLETGPYVYSGMHDILDLAREKGEPLFILILDQLQNPQNLGTLLRTAESVGVHGVLIPLAHTAGVTPAVVHASSGACEHLLIAQSNLSQAISNLKETGVWVIGLEDSPEASPLDHVRLDGPLALVVGSEGAGLRPLTRKSCDLLMRLPTKGKVESLNASVAGSIALFQASISRKA